MLLSLSAHAHMFYVLMMMLVTVHTAIVHLKIFLNMLVVMNVSTVGVVTIVGLHVMFHMLVMMFMSVFHNDLLAELLG
jgi:hypothetical protein